MDPSQAGGALEGNAAPCDVAVANATWKSGTWVRTLPREKQEEDQGGEMVAAQVEA